MTLFIPQINRSVSYKNAPLIHVYFRFFKFKSNVMSGCTELKKEFQCGYFGFNHDFPKLFVLTEVCDI
jgi:hypothetical protein